MLVGQRLGAYEILAKIGEGGMGEVYRASDTTLGRNVALKVITPELARSPEQIDRFRREAQTLAALDHPNIVTVFSVEEAGGIHFLTMQLVEGKPLDAVIPDHGLPFERIVGIGVAIADALTAAHERHIIHRDLKPANVIIGIDDRVKVLDFGLAKDVTSAGPAESAQTRAAQTHAGLVVGTPAYMSPEQIAGRAVDQRSDIFSLGVVLYEMATGKRPFAGDSTMEIASAILRDTPPAVAERRTDLPADLTRLIRRCLEKDPRDRIQTARDVANECRELLQRDRARDGAPSRSSSTPSSGSMRRDEGFWIAVLPFKSTSAHEDVAAFADGMSEEIITGLSRFLYLRIVARSSTIQYAHAPADIRTVGRDLGARYVLEGSVRQSGSQLRVAVQLLDTANGAHVWAETFNRTFDSQSLFDVQDDLVSRIVGSVADSSGALARDMTEKLRGRPRAEMTANEILLRVMSFYAHATPSEHAEIRADLEYAVQQAPNHGEAWAMLANVYHDEYRLRFNPRPHSLDRALTAARRAIELAPSSHFSHQVLSSILYFRRDLPGFRSASERAVTTNPLDPSVLAYQGALRAYAGDWAAGLKLVERAMTLNPHHQDWFWFPVAFDAYRRHDYHAALDAAVKINMAGFFFIPLTVAAIYAQLGNRDAARTALRELLQLEPEFATIGRHELSKWFVEPTLVDHFIDGLQKAGLGASAPLG